VSCTKATVRYRVGAIPAPHGRGGSAADDRANTRHCTSASYGLRTGVVAG
jgi:hypothetical protein